jgi:hypothetical protein
MPSTSTPVAIQAIRRFRDLRVNLRISPRSNLRRSRAARLASARGLGAPPANSLLSGDRVAEAGASACGTAGSARFGRGPDGRRFSRSPDTPVASAFFEAGGRAAGAAA